jgi:hypothetical protein
VTFRGIPEGVITLPTEERGGSGPCFIDDLPSSDDGDAGGFFKGLDQQFAAWA